jgi:hypothetical protein
MRTRSAASASLATVLFLAVSALTSFAARPDYDIKKISPAVDLTPQISFNFGPTSHPTTTRSQQWLEVEVNFESNVDWTDELTVRYFILLAGQCLTGEVTHIDIPRGRDLYSVAFVSPKTIARILNGKPLSSLDIQDVGVQLVSKGQVLTTKSYKTQGDQQWWQSQPQVTGKVLNKNQTPFASLYWDRYEQIKAPATPQ